MKRLNTLPLVIAAEPGATFIDHASVAFVVYGQCYSQKNSRSPNGKGGTFKHPKALRFEKDFSLQVPSGARRGLGSMVNPVRVIVSVFYPTWKQDLDVSIVYDLLQKTGVVANDRFIREKHEYAAIDKDNPRVELVIEEM